MSISFISAFAQTHGVITTIAGNGTSGYLGDNGPALSANFFHVYGVAHDGQGNIYINDRNNQRIRKISNDGVITTIAGNGTAGYSGDGGAATAAQINFPFGIAADAAGNIYIADFYNNAVRKVTPSGIITTIAGTGTAGFSGDGGAATAAELIEPQCVCVDAAGNIYIGDGGNHRVRKVNTAGIITTVAGNGSVSAPDGIPATDAALSTPSGICFDRHGNMFIVDIGHTNIRKVNTTGIISTIIPNGSSPVASGGPATSAYYAGQLYGAVVDTQDNLYVGSDYYLWKIDAFGMLTPIAGNGASGYSGDGGPDTLAAMSTATGIDIDAMDNLYFTDFGNNVVRKITLPPSVSANNFAVYITRNCSGPQLSIVTNLASSSLSVKTWFGDGATASTPLTSSGILSSGMVSHAYALSGSYSVKQALYNGSSPVDSVSYTYEYVLCTSFPLKLFVDDNANGVMESTESYLYVPCTIKVDSNGIPIDTISATSGMYYNAYGSMGDIYTFSVLSLPSGFHLTGASVVRDTIKNILYNYYTRYLGFGCSATSAFDLSVHHALIAGRHYASGSILVANSYCTPKNATVSLDFSPKYDYYDAYPAPASSSAHAATWNISALASNVPKPVLINFSLSIPNPSSTATWLTPGDTVNSTAMIAPGSGDGDPTDNISVNVDTIRSSYDPNEMMVSPSGFINAGTQLQYTITFENTGNDTAHNIYIMDTLSGNLDAQSLRVLGASAAMNITMIKYGTQKIARFDFPAINLLDSSHHGLCTGLVIYTIKAKSDLSPGTVITGHAGIFFDDNPVVTTDTTQNTIAWPEGTAIYPGFKAAVFPNPFSNELNVTIDRNMGYRLLNVTGGCIMGGHVSAGNNVIDAGAVPPGIYILELTAANGEKHMLKVVRN